MKYLIDTHIFLWIAFEPKKIPKKTIEILSDPKNKIFISSVSFWEISVKYSLGKLCLSNFFPQDLPKVALDMGIEIIDIDHVAMASYHRLPKIDSHKDPFDKMIVWFALSGDFILVSLDGRLGEYEQFGLKIL